MKHFSIRSALLGLCIALATDGCKKGMDAPLQVSHQTTATAGDLVRALDSSTCHLFDQAFHRAALDSLFSSQGGYTIFAPTDSAMIAAGLTAQLIGGLSPDSLAKLVKYHIVQVSFDDASLSSAEVNAQAGTLLEAVTADPVLGDVVYQYALYLEERNSVLYVDGEPVGTGIPATPATNGYLFTIRRFLRVPAGTVWDVIATDPRLDLYRAALRIDDSISLAFQISQYPYPPYGTDSIWWSTLDYANQGNKNPSDPQSFTTNLPTVFAPTDSAFYAAGFYTVDDIRQYALRTPMAPGIYIPPNNLQDYVNTPMDSILYTHVVFNQTTTQPGSPLLLYNDMQYSPLLNHGLPNANQAQLLNWSALMYYYQVYPLVFSVKGDLPYIQWAPGSSMVPVPAGADRHFVTTNGAVYLVDQLFYSPN